MARHWLSQPTMLYEVPEPVVCSATNHNLVHVRTQYGQLHLHRSPSSTWRALRRWGLKNNTSFVLWTFNKCLGLLGLLLQWIVGWWCLRRVEISLRISFFLSALLLKTKTEPPPSAEQSREGGSRPYPACTLPSALIFLSTWNPIASLYIW